MSTLEEDETQQSIMNNIRDLAAMCGLELNDEAHHALASMQPDHVEELLQSVTRKVQIGTVTNASNYICAAIKRGYTSNESYQAAKGDGKGGSFGSFAGRGKGPVGGKPSSDGEVHAALQRVAAAGVMLSEEATAALNQVLPEHAVEILDHVILKAGELRDPSNYVAATIARGYQPRNDFKGGLGEGKFGGKGKYDDYGAQKLQPQHWPPESSSWGKSSYGDASWATSSTNARPAAVLPSDITALEQMVVDLNLEGLWGEQQFDVNTLLMLRCVPEGQAKELLGSFAGKARAMKGKGKGISNINNFVQSAIVKILRGDRTYEKGGYQDGKSQPQQWMSLGGQGGYGDYNGGYPPAKRGRWEA
mmetsp:Transcript_58792/g.140141  ORF Transcript_58792/g.140141 Transcript_58792/m.140141 type:complete len:362 (+) Transcript_58792:73-1158(+)